MAPFPEIINLESSMEKKIFVYSCPILLEFLATKCKIFFNSARARTLILQGMIKLSVQEYNVGVLQFSLYCGIWFSSLYVQFLKTFIVAELDLECKAPVAFISLSGLSKQKNPCSGQV